MAAVFGSSKITCCLAQRYGEIQLPAKPSRRLVDLINDQVDNTAVRAKYQGQSATFTLKDLGIEVDGEAIASDVINAQRGDAWWQQYAFWITHDVAPQINPELADGSVVDKALNIDAQEPVDAQVALNDNNSGFNVIAGENGQGANATSIAKQAISTVESLGSVQPQTVRVELDVTEPTITNAIADEAKTTLETLVNNAVAIKVADKDIATVNASMLGSAMRIDANQQSKLKDNEVRNGYVVFDADKLQQYYDEQIKPNLKLEREDKKVVVNNAGEVLSTETEGHDGIVIADGADTEVGARLAQVLATGTGSVNVDGKVDPKQEVKVAHRVAIDLSDRKLYAYENDTVVKTLNVVVAEGNDNVTGECVGMMCTPTGDFNVWQKLPSQDMSGTLNLARWHGGNMGCQRRGLRQLLLLRLRNPPYCRRICSGCRNALHCQRISWLRGYRMGCGRMVLQLVQYGHERAYPSVICNSVICNKYGMQWCDT